MHEIEPSSAPIYARQSFLIACLALMCVAWAFVIPPFGGADEPGHFLRSAAMARGQLTGAEQVNPPDGILYWRTMVELDPRFDQANAFPVCFRFNMAAPACQFRFANPGDEVRPPTSLIPVDVGLYPPGPYLIPAIGTIFGPTLTSLYSARLLQAAACLTLLAWAFATAKRRGGFGSTGILVIATPAVFFFGSTVNPSGLELAGALAGWYLLMEFWDHERLSRVSAMQIAAALVVCTMARPLGPLLTATILGCTFVASGLSIRHGIKRIGQHRALATTVAGAGGLSVAWYLTKFSSATGRDLVGRGSLSAVEQLRAGLDFFPELLRDAIGNFGWLDTPAPRTVWVPWVGAMILVSLVGLWRAPTQRQRAGAIGALGAGAFVMISALFQSYNLFSFLALQTRHYLPFVFGLFVLLMDRMPALSKRATAVFAVGWAGGQSLCLAQAARRYLYGIPTSPLAPGLTKWSPLLPVWGMVVLGSMASCAAAAHLCLRQVEVSS